MKNQVEQQTSAWYGSMDRTGRRPTRPLSGQTEQAITRAMETTEDRISRTVEAGMARQIAEHTNSRISAEITRVETRMRQAPAGGATERRLHVELRRLYRLLAGCLP